MYRNGIHTMYIQNIVEFRLYRLTIQHRILWLDKYNIDIVVPTLITVNLAKVDCNQCWNLYLCDAEMLHR